MRSWYLTSILVAALCGAAAGRQATPAPQREPESGTVLRARMETSYQREKRVIEVTFRQDPKHEFPVPDTMDERYTGPDERINARTTYSDIRRFQVVTTAVIGNPR
jgi:hypothetical protein